MGKSNRIFSFIPKLYDFSLLTIMFCKVTPGDFGESASALKPQTTGFPLGLILFSLPGSAWRPLCIQTCLVPFHSGGIRERL